MIVHARVPEVEPLEVADGGRLDDLWGAEAFDCARNDGDVVVYEGEFVRDRQVRDCREICRCRREGGVGRGLIG